MKTRIVLGLLALCMGIKLQAQDKIALSKIEFLGHVYAVNGSDVTPLEKTTASTKVKVKVFGMGGSTATLEAPGTASSVKLNTTAPVFVIKTGGSTPPEMTLFQLKVTKKTRAATLQDAGLGGMKNVKGMVSLNVAKVQDGVFKIVPAQSLEKGEYFFQNRSAGGNVSTWEVYAFSVI